MALGQNDAKPFRLAIEGGSLEGGKQEDQVRRGRNTSFSKKSDGVYRVEQVYDTRPRSNGSIAWPSAIQAAVQAPATTRRNSDGAFGTVAATAESTPPPAGGEGFGVSPPGVNPSGPPMGLGPPPSGPPGMGLSGSATSGPASQTFNGLERKRYISRTDQVRGVPIGLSLIADQSFVQDALTAVSNCKLRFQTVQSNLTRYRGSVTYANSSTEEGAGPKPGVPGPGVPGPGGPSLGSLGPPPGSPMVGTGAGPPAGYPGSGGNTPRSSNEDQVASNLVEMTLYGIASLYEKFEVVKKDESTTKDPVAPPTPAPPTPPAKGDVPAKGDTPPKDGVPSTPMPPKN